MLTALLCSFILSAAVAPAAGIEPRNGGNAWNTFQADAKALGDRCISSTANEYKPPAATGTDRIASYRVTFAKAGTYDLYGRLMPNPGKTRFDMYYSRVFGIADDWQEVKNLTIPAGEYTWVNLSERFGSKKSGDNTFTVAAPGQVTYRIASRTRGPRIDAFAFGTSTETFTDAQLDAAVVGSADAGLLGFQAESAAAFGSDTLTEAGQKLQANYAQMLSAWKAELKKALPTIDDAKKAALFVALQAEQQAATELAKTETSWRRGYLNKKSKLTSLQERLKDAPGRLADAKAALERALAMPDGDEDRAEAIQAAKEDMAKQQAYLDKLQSSIEKAKEALESAKRDEPTLAKQVDEAQRAMEQAQADCAKALQALGLDRILASDELDGKLASCGVLTAASPRGLAKLAQQGPAEEKRIDQLLADKDLMIQMLVADGPREQEYGPAMKIYTAIQKVSPEAKEGLFQRLALAVALEHAVPMVQGNAEALQGTAPEHVDPIKRYLSYERAYLENELDPSFANHGVWSLRMVVNGGEPDEISAWGRAMLRDYRPDLIALPLQDGRYVQVVDSEIYYSSKLVEEDRPELQQYQNVLANGGICGRRAFFGRFMLRAFGVPTTARPQGGHAALVHWTPSGWEPRLGGGWGCSNRTIFHGYATDLDFQASSQAREDAEAFMQVKRAQWIGALLGEERVYGYTKEEPEFWHCVALLQQNQIIDTIEAEGQTATASMSVASGPLATVDAADIPAADRKITVDEAGVITIPAVACRKPANNTTLTGWGPTDVVKFMESNLGGMQLHYSRYGGASDAFEYALDVPKAGKYQLTARIVTPSWRKHLYLSVNGDSEIDIHLPYTIGLWGELEPVDIDLVQGQNVLTFAGPSTVAIRDFTLTPAGNQ